MRHLIHAALFFTYTTILVIVFDTIVGLSVTSALRWSGARYVNATDSFTSATVQSENRVFTFTLLDRSISSELHNRTWQIPTNIVDFSRCRDAEFFFVSDDGSYIAIFVPRDLAVTTVHSTGSWSTIRLTNIERIAQAQSFFARLSESGKFVIKVTVAGIVAVDCKSSSVRYYYNGYVLYVSCAMMYVALKICSGLHVICRRYPILIKLGERKPHLTSLFLMSTSTFIHILLFMYVYFLM